MRPVMLCLFVLVVAGVLFFVPGVSDSLAAIEYQSIIASTDFDGVKADVRTTSSAILSIVFIILGVALIIGIITR